MDIEFTDWTQSKTWSKFRSGEFGSIPRDQFDAAQIGFKTALSRTIRTAMFETERRAKRNVPVDTGWLKNTIYTRTADGNYADGVKIEGRPKKLAEKRYSEKRRETVYQPGKYARESRQKQPVDGEVASTNVAAEYGIYVEDGTVNMAAQPYLGPAFDEVIQLVPGLMRKNLEAEGLA